MQLINILATHTNRCVVESFVGRWKRGLLLHTAWSNFHHLPKRSLPMQQSLSSELQILLSQHFQHSSRTET